MENLTEFELLVLEMRKHQFQYFKKRDRDSLLKSKSLEREVDKQLYNKINPKLGL